jgi:hypothetical protein
MTYIEIIAEIKVADRTSKVVFLVDMDDFSRPEQGAEFFGYQADARFKRAFSEVTRGSICAGDLIGTASWDRIRKTVAAGCDDYEPQDDAKQFLARKGLAAWTADSAEATQ